MNQLVLLEVMLIYCGRLCWDIVGGYVYILSEVMYIYCRRRNWQVYNWSSA